MAPEPTSGQRRAITQRSNALHHLRATSRMLAHARPLALVKAPGLVQEARFDLNFSNVDQRRATLDELGGFGAELHAPGEPSAPTRHRTAMIQRVRIVSLQDGKQSCCCFLAQLRIEAWPRRELDRGGDSTVDFERDADAERRDVAALTPRCATLRRDRRTPGCEDLTKSRNLV